MKTENPRKSARNSDGFTITELMFVLVLSGILLALAAPSFGSMIGRNQIEVQTNNLHASLQTARYVALMRHELVQLCQVDDMDNPECSSDYSSYRNWSPGWLVFIDKNRNNQLDDGDEKVKVYHGTDMVQILFNQRGRLRFFPNGTARSAGFTLCDTHNGYYRHVYLLYTGRARTSHKTTARQRQKCAEAAAAQAG